MCEDKEENGVTSGESEDMTTEEKKVVKVQPHESWVERREGIDGSEDSHTCMVNKHFIQVCIWRLGSDKGLKVWTNKWVDEL